jgi:hypothetical protein
MNKENYRVGDATDSSAAGIYAGGTIIEGFAPDKLEYTVKADINKSYPEITVLASSSVASAVVEKVGLSVVKVTVTSGDGKNSTVYTINFEVTGSFTASSTVVNKNGADATVSFVIDDGFVKTGRFAKSMLEKYPTLTLSFAIFTNKFVTLKTEDIDGDGIKEYVRDANGNYTYTIRDTSADAATGFAGQEMIDFWRDVLTSTPGRSEIIAHSHTHAFWGTNDEGGSMFAIGNSSGTIGKNPTTFAKGSITAEMYASQQIISDLFGNLGSRAKTFVTPGISVTGSTKKTGSDVTILLRGHIVRLVNDTAISQTSTAGELVVNSDAEIDLQSNKLTIPAGTPISTTATYSNNVIPAGTVITVIECSMVVPAGTEIKGHGTAWAAVYDKAYDDGVTIAARNTGAKATLNDGIYNKDFFGSINNRQLQRSFGISSKKDETPEQLEADVQGWCSYIDKAVELKGWVSYCIHAITDTLDSNIENQGGHMITKAQGETLFSHAVSYGDKIWIANYTDATLYYHEWNSAKTTASYNASTGEITVSLTDNERDDIYNMPLTVKVAVPGTWQSATVGENTYEVRYNSDGTAYVYVDIAPETSVVVKGN